MVTVVTAADQAEVPSRDPDPIKGPEDPDEVIAAVVVHGTASEDAAVHSGVRVKVRPGAEPNPRVEPTRVAPAVVVMAGEVGDPRDQGVVKEPKTLYGDHRKEATPVAAKEIDPLRPVGVADGATDLKGPHGRVAAIVAALASGVQAAVVGRVGLQRAPRPDPPL